MTGPYDEHSRKIDETRRIVLETKRLLQEVIANQERLSDQLDVLDEVILNKYRRRASDKPG